jgi:hypothetical protein
MALEFVCQQNETHDASGALQLYLIKTRWLQGVYLEK